MVFVVFRSRLRPDVEEEFEALADEMMEIAQSMPGFVSYRVYTSEDGERVSLIEFETAEQLRAWRVEPRHREAQRIGCERFYEEYTLRVAESMRESHFRHEPDTTP